MKKKLLSFLGAMFVAQISFSQISETFNYTNGTLLTSGNPAWSQPAVVNATTGNELKILETSFAKIGTTETKSVRLSGPSSAFQSSFSLAPFLGSTETDAYFNASNSKILYVALAVNVASAAEGNEYFANVSGGLNSGKTTINARGRVFAKNIDGKLAFGVSWGANSGEGEREYTTATYDFNKTYILVLKYTSGTPDKGARLFVFDSALPASEPSPILSVTSSENATQGQAFVIRHTSTTQNILVGGLIASTSWPTGMAITKSTLPISLIDFKGFEENGVVRLNWSTSSERNNNHFEILKSLDGVNFNSLGTVAGGQNSSEKNYYTFLDNSSSSQLVYYKLKQVDNDGESEEFSPIVLKLDKLNNNDVSVYKSNDNLIKVVFNSEEGLISANLHTIDGRKVSEVSKFVNVSGQQILIFEEPLPLGIYVLNLVISNKSVTRKIVL